MFNIIGAGMAGLIAGYILYQNGKLHYICERSGEIPNNHTALLRFRSSIVGDAVGIPFREVDIIKSVHSHHKTEVAQSLAYAIKTTGNATLRSVISTKGEKEQRFIAPDDFIPRLSQRLSNNLLLASSIKKSDFSGDERPKYISTIPMPSLAKMLEYDGFENTEFKYAKGWTLRIKLKNTSACATIYFPDDQYHFYRASITDNMLIIEYCNPNDSDSFNENIKTMMDSPIVQKQEIRRVLKAFGLYYDYASGEPKISETRYAKILPIDEDERRRFIIWATDRYGIYSLGRFATWRPALMMDDLIQDIRLIENMEYKSDYDKRKRS